MIQLLSNDSIIRNMLLSRYAMRILTLITAVFMMGYLLTGILKLGILSLFAYGALLSLEIDSKINALRMEIRKGKV